MGSLTLDPGRGGLPQREWVLRGCRWPLRSFPWGGWSVFIKNAQSFCAHASGPFSCNLCTASHLRTAAGDKGCSQAAGNQQVLEQRQSPSHACFIAVLVVVIVPDSLSVLALPLRTPITQGFKVTLQVE